MDDSPKQSLIIDEKDRDLPRGPIALPKDPEIAAGDHFLGAKALAEASGAESSAVASVAAFSVAAQMQPPPQPPPIAIDSAQKSQSLGDRLLELKDQGAKWFKEHMFLGIIIGLILFGVLLYFWPLITSALIAQHMLTNAKGTSNKANAYRFLAILMIAAISIQAIWIVQLAQASAFR